MSMRTVGWPSERSTAKSVMPGIAAITSFILLAVRSSTLRSPPYSLTEFSPFTPDAASSTLSSIYWEKLKSTPGNRSVSFARHVGDQRFLVHAGGPGVERLERHEELGVEEAGGVRAVIRAAVLGDDGDRLRIALDAAVACRSRGASPASSEIDVGSVARIHRLPSSSLGRNSRPRADAAQRADQRAARPCRRASGSGWSARSASAARSRGAGRAPASVSRLLHLRGQEERATAPG